MGGDNATGQIGLWSFSDVYGLRPGLAHMTVPIEGKVALIPPALSTQYAFGSGDPAGMRLAHWFLVLLFLVPWSGWLAWRWRRMRKLADPL